MRLKGKTWLVQFFSAANNYANKKKKKRFEWWLRMVTRKRCFVLVWLLPGRHAYFVFCLDLISFLNHCRTEELSSKHGQPSLLVPNDLPLQMLALFSSSVRKNKANFIKLVENSGVLKVVSFYIFNQGSVVFAWFSIFRTTVYCKWSLCLSYIQSKEITSVVCCYGNNQFLPFHHFSTSFLCLLQCVNLTVWF